MAFNYKNTSLIYLVISFIILLFAISKNSNSYLIITVAIIASALYLTALFFGSYLIQLNFHTKSINRGNKNTKKISITFDDGPNPNITSKLIETLEKHHIKATFFLIGEKIEQNPEIVKLIFEKGHTIGNHSFTHSNLFDLKTSKKMFYEIEKTNEIIFKILGLKIKLFRPPFGITNPMLAKALKNSKMQSIGWSLRSLDTIRTVEKTIKNIKSKLKNGDIILFHDNNPKIIEIIDELILFTQKNGIEIVSIENLLNIEPYENI